MDDISASSGAVVPFLVNGCGHSPCGCTRLRWLFERVFSVMNSDAFAVNTVEVSLEGFCAFPWPWLRVTFEISVCFCA